MLRILIRTLSLLPLSALYALMQAVVYPLVFYVVRYRRKLVRRNISTCFPDRSEEECRRIEKQFYHFFADLLAEIIHGYRASDEEMRERIVFETPEEVEAVVEACKEHHGGIYMLGHMGNWEWIADIGKRFEHIFKLHVVYRPLKSKSADSTMRELRGKRACDCVDMHLLIRKMFAAQKEEDVHVWCILSDQKPSQNELYCWTDFLHHDTPFITGSEVLAKRFDMPVWYIDIRMVKRGYYVGRPVLITMHPNETEQGYITRRYAELLEQNIAAQPHIWLWSHNRFKWRRQDNKKGIFWS